MLICSIVMVVGSNFCNSITSSKFTSPNDVASSTLDFLGLGLDDCKGIASILSYEDLDLEE